MDNLIEYGEKTFESIKHINEYGQEYWLARELQIALDYKRWADFSNALLRARDACVNAGNDADDHFRRIAKIVPIGSGAERDIGDVEMSRYACYLLVMNGDPRKEIIAYGQTYFAVKTRQQELIDNYEELNEDQKRIAIRSEIKKHNAALADAAHDAGVIEPKDYAIFQNYGYMGLYGGLKAKDIRMKKGLKQNQDILDYMGSEELAANLFRATQTEAKLRRENVKGKQAANNTHYVVGHKVRETISELGGTMPEDLPTPEKSVKQLEREQKKIEKK
jgi:hypothetical protein